MTTKSCDCIDCVALRPAMRLLDAIATSPAYRYMGYKDTDRLCEARGLLAEYLRLDYNEATNSYDINREQHD